MNIRVKYIILCVILFFLSCERGNKRRLSINVVDEVVFNKVDALSPVDSVWVPQNFYMDGWHVFDSIVVVHALHAEKILYVYSYPQFDSLYSFGEVGKASEEFLTHNWCVANESKRVALYDIMKSLLSAYSVDDKQMVMQRTYALSQNEDGLCKPYTKILQLNDSMFLMKEDGDDTDLHYMNLNNGQVLSSYHCSLRDGKSSSYTPYDYDFNVVDDKLLLVYNYLPRMELLSITSDGQLIPQLFIGDANWDVLPQNYDELPYIWLGICTDGHSFYCLKSDNGLEAGREVCVLDVDGTPVRRINLGSRMNSIQIDREGRLITYKEVDDGAFFYIYNQ